MIIIHVIQIIVYVTVMATSAVLRCVHGDCVYLVNPTIKSFIKNSASLFLTCKSTHFFYKRAKEECLYYLYSYVFCAFRNVSVFVLHQYIISEV